MNERDGLAMMLAAEREKSAKLAEALRQALPYLSGYPENVARAALAEWEAQ